MTVRSDIVVDWTLSPRIILIEGTDELSIQDLVDTCRFLEMGPTNFSEDHLIEASGKEELGSGVLVGITAKLRNAKVAFKANTTVIASGLVDSDDPTGTTLIDNDVDFVTLGVLPGAVFCNNVSDTLCTVKKVEVHKLTCYPLSGGGFWTVGDSYWGVNNIQRNISGGNLVAVDANGNDMPCVLPTAFIQVVRAASSSATLQELDQVYDAVIGMSSSVEYVSGSMTYLSQSMIELSGSTEQTYDAVQSMSGSIAQVSGSVDKIEKIERGKWKIDTTTNRMTFYGEDSVTIIAQFNLFDENGNPTSVNVFSREPV